MDQTEVLAIFLSDHAISLSIAVLLFLWIFTRKYKRKRIPVKPFFAPVNIRQLHNVNLGGFMGLDRQLSGLGYIKWMEFHSPDCIFPGITRLYKGEFGIIGSVVQEKPGEGAEPLALEFYSSFLSSNSLVTTNRNRGRHWMKSIKHKIHIRSGAESPEQIHDFHVQRLYELRDGGETLLSHEQEKVFAVLERRHDDVMNDLVQIGYYRRRGNYYIPTVKHVLLSFLGF